MKPSYKLHCSACASPAIEHPLIAGELAVANEKRNALKILATHIEKAVRRGEKLEKTLLKVVAQSEAGSPAEEFLKAVQRGVKKLKKESKEIGLLSSSARKKAVAEPESATQSAPEPAKPRPVNRIRRKSQANVAPAPVSGSAIQPE